MTARKVERRLISELEACAALGVCRKTLLAHVRAGEIRYVLTGKRTRKYRSRDLNDFIERQSRQCLSTNDLIPDTGNSTSLSTVIGFEEARKRRREPKRTPMRPKSVSKKLGAGPGNERV